MIDAAVAIPIATTSIAMSTCKRYRNFLASHVEDWRSFALVQLATLANKQR